MKEISLEDRLVKGENIYHDLIIYFISTIEPEKQYELRFFNNIKEVEVYANSILHIVPENLISHPHSKMGSIKSAQSVAEYNKHVEEKVCKKCGKTFMGRRTRNYCSEECESKAVKHVCVFCGEFFWGHKNSKYCCAEHRQQHQNILRKEDRKLNPK